MFSIHHQFSSGAVAKQRKDRELDELSECIFQVRLWNITKYNISDSELAFWFYTKCVILAAILKTVDPDFRLVISRNGHFEQSLA